MVTSEVVHSPGVVQAEDSEPLHFEKMWYTIRRGGSVKQVLEEKHEVDAQGNPAGGSTTGTGVIIEWQNGPLGRGAERKEPNGAFVEGVIQAALGRLKYYQSTPFECEENYMALVKLEEALMWLQKRTDDREARQVEGTHTK